MSIKFFYLNKGFFKKSSNTESESKLTCCWVTLLANYLQQTATKLQQGMETKVFLDFFEQSKLKIAYKENFLT